MSDLTGQGGGAAAGAPTLEDLAKEALGESSSSSSSDAVAGTKRKRHEMFEKKWGGGGDALLAQEEGKKVIKVSEQDQDPHCVFHSCSNALQSEHMYVSRTDLEPAVRSLHKKLTDAKDLSADFPFMALYKLVAKKVDDGVISDVIPELIEEASPYSAKLLYPTAKEGESYGVNAPQIIADAKAGKFSSGRFIVHGYFLGADDEPSWHEMAIVDGVLINSWWTEKPTPMTPEKPFPRTYTPTEVYQIYDPRTFASSPYEDERLLRVAKHAEKTLSEKFQPRIERLVELLQTRSPPKYMAARPTGPWRAVTERAQREGDTSRENKARITMQLFKWARDKGYIDKIFPKPPR